MLRSSWSLCWAASISAMQRIISKQLAVSTQMVCCFVMAYGCSEAASMYILCILCLKNELKNKANVLYFHR